MMRIQLLVLLLCVKEKNVNWLLSCHQLTLVHVVRGYHGYI
jgi:hypothetical protein